MTVADNLKKIREERNLTKKELCEKAGLSERAYLTYEFGEREPKIGVICKLADFYGVTTDYLLGREADPVKRIVSLLSESDKALIANYSALSGKTRDEFIQIINRIFAGVAPYVERTEHN